jgi:hypothetical protein
MRGTRLGIYSNYLKFYIFIVLISLEKVYTLHIICLFTIEYVLLLTLLVNNKYSVFCILYFVFCILYDIFLNIQRNHIIIITNLR